MAARGVTATEVKQGVLHWARGRTGAGPRDVWELDTPLITQGAKPTQLLQEKNTAKQTNKKPST